MIYATVDDQHVSVGGTDKTRMDFLVSRTNAHSVQVLQMLIDLSGVKDTMTDGSDRVSWRVAFASDTLQPTVSRTSTWKLHDYDVS